MTSPPSPLSCGLSWRRGLDRLHPEHCDRDTVDLLVDEALRLARTVSGARVGGGGVPVPM